MKYLYKYPQREFPYRDLIETNWRRSRIWSIPAKTQSGSLRSQEIQFVVKNAD